MSKKVNQVKTKAALEKRLKELNDRYDKEIHANMVEAVNSYLTHNSALSDNQITWGIYHKMADNICLSASWMVDRLRMYYGHPNSDTYRKSLSKKIRRALGYTI